MTYDQQPQYQQQPPVVPGTPQSPAGWMPYPAPPQPPAKGRAVPWLVAGLVCAVLVASGLLFVLVGGKNAPKSPAPAASPPPALTSAGAERACRTAFGDEFKARQEANVKKDIVVSTQGIDLIETWKYSMGYKVNGTIRYSLTAWPLDPVQDTLELTCTVTGTDDAPTTTVDNRN